MEKLPPIPTPAGTAFREFRHRVVPLLAFAGVLAATAFTWHSYLGPTLLVGQVETVRATVASTSAGRVASLKVGHLEHVSAGQPVAQVLVIEPKVFDAQVELVKARIEGLRVGIDPELRKNNNLINYQNLRLSWMEKRAELASTRSRTPYLEAEAERQAKMYEGGSDRGVTSLADLERARADLAANRGQIEELNRLVAEMDHFLKEIASGESRLDQQLPAATRAAIAIEERQLNLLEAQLAPVVLTAPIDGIVSAVLRRPGETVAASDAILTVTSDRTDRVLAFVRQPLKLTPQPGMTLQVQSRSGARKLAVGRVLTVGTALEPILPALLPRVASGANAPSELGLPVLVSIPQELDVHPGEVVDLRP